MIVEDKIKEVINTLSKFFEFKLLDLTDAGGDSDNELNIEITSQDIITELEIRAALMTIRDVKFHIICIKNIAAILVDVNEPHIA